MRTLLTAAVAGALFTLGCGASAHDAAHETAEDRDELKQSEHEYLHPANTEEHEDMHEDMEDVDESEMDFHEEVHPD